MHELFHDRARKVNAVAQLSDLGDSANLFASSALWS